jgi:pullulanase
MIDALHRRGLKVTLDVVFNHTFEALDKNLVFSFEGLVPGYYYRLRADGSYWNGSGTGNEFRTEAPMARRYLLDCLKHWVTEYKVDGFRFDLLGLIDRETIELLVKELHALEPSLLLYGEPWAGGATPIEIAHKGAQRGRGWAVFNDHFRDALKGNVGFLQAGANVHGVKRGIAGALDDFTASPLETINYIECHDNHTLWDRLLISTVDNAAITEADRRAMDKLAAVLLLTAQGIPFLHAGQEFLRSKGWQTKALNYDVFDYYRGLLALRRAQPLLRQEKAEKIRQSLKFFDEQLHLTVPEHCLAFLLEDSPADAETAALEQDTWSRALVLANPHATLHTFAIPAGHWQVYADHRASNTTPLTSSNVFLDSTHVVLKPWSALVLGELRTESG